MVGGCEAALACVARLLTLSRRPRLIFSGSRRWPSSLRVLSCPWENCTHGIPSSRLHIHFKLPAGLPPAIFSAESSMCLICKTLLGFISLLSGGDFFSLCVRLLVCTASAEQRSSSPRGLPAQSPPFPPGPTPNPESSAVSCAVRAGLAKCASRYDHAENMPAGLTRLTRGAAVRPGPALLSALSSRDLLAGETQQLPLGQRGLRGAQPRFATQIVKKKTT